MQDKPPYKKKKKKLGYRTPNRFRRMISRKKPVITTRPRSLGGHQ